MTSDNTPSPVLKEIKELQQFFTAALSHLQEGQVLNMTGMDKRISLVCEAAQNAKPEEQQVFLPELTALINLLNAYEDELRKIQSSLAAETAKENSDGAS